MPIRQPPAICRMRLASCCRALWLREDVASSTALWGDLLVFRPSLLAGRQVALAAWLAKRRLGVVSLQLRCGGDEAVSVAPVLHALAGGALADLTISDCPRLGEAGEAAAALSVQHLEGLSRLVLEECTLSSLPPSLSALPSLRVLWVPLNGALGRCGGAQLGAALRRLSQLTELSLRACRLSQLPPELGSLTQLLALDVGSNQGLGEAPAAAATASAALDAALSALQPLSRLTRLDLSWCRLQRVPGFLSTFASLADLSLDVNGGLGEGGYASFLPLQHGTLTALRRLGLSYCRLYALPYFLPAVPQLADLCLNSNMALGDGSLAPLRGCSMLTLLHLRECGLHTVPKELCDLPLLVELDLSWNTQLGQGHEAATFRALAHLSASLTYLDLGKCFLERLPPQVSHLTALRHLGLWNNWSLGQHAGHGGEWHATSRFEGLERLTGLTHLGLGMCGLEQVPKEVAALSHLAHLNLSNNRLGGGGPAALQPLVPLRHSLTHLDLQSCGLESLPAQLSALVSLVHLDFSGN